MDLIFFKNNLKKDFNRYRIRNLTKKEGVTDNKTRAKELLISSFQYNLFLRLKFLLLVNKLHIQACLICRLKYFFNNIFSELLRFNEIELNDSLLIKLEENAASLLTILTLSRK